MLTTLHRACLLLAILFLAAPPLLAQGFDRQTFDRWVTMRVGAGEPVYWYSTGTLRAYPGGELLATIEGYDTARLLPAESTAERALQASRKVYRYLDPESGEPMRDGDGEPVPPIAYPYQFISYELDGERMVTWVEQGAGERLQRIGPGDSIRATAMGDGVLFSAPLFLDLDTPRGPYQTFENYDFYYPPGGALDGSYITFVRYGDAPAWASARKAVMHMTTQRFDRYDAVPADFRRWIEESMPLWRQPPADLADIRRLQAAPRQVSGAGAP
jgi:hypothetical protein